MHIGRGLEADLMLKLVRSTRHGRPAPWPSRLPAVASWVLARQSSNAGACAVVVPGQQLPERRTQGSSVAQIPGTRARCIGAGGAAAAIGFVGQAVTIMGNSKSGQHSISR